MSGWKKVTEEEFKVFLKDYPRPLKTNFFMDWLEYYDFPDGVHPKNLEELHSYQVARIYRCYGLNDFYIKAESEEE